MIVEREHESITQVVDDKKQEETSFQKKLRELWENPEKWKRELQEFVNDPEVQAYYKNPDNLV